MQLNQLSNQVLDEVDMKILVHLQSDASISNAELAKQIGLSPSACLGRTKRLKQSGVIKQYVTLVDERQVGLHVITYVFVSLTPHDRQTTEAFLDHVREIPNIMECHNISGVHDYLLKIIATSIKDYRDFIIDTLIEVPGVDKVETSVVLSTEKLIHQLPMEAGFFSDDPAK